jgi:glycerol transport system ATP-binding protein
MATPSGPEDYALRRMDHTWQDGGAYALLGPSGCGKTTLLNIISGLVTPSEGQVLFNGKEVTHLPPEHRNIAQVFQFPVIYDTMTVRENLAFPLQNRGMDQSYIRQRVETVADMLGLTEMLERKAAGLGADEKQKISMGRGLVREDVAAVLFDEPLTVIDPHMKWQLRRKLKELHETLSLTLVYVTHDQIEALTFADKVVVLYGGRVVQLGTPQELFEEPAHTFVGYFIGSPGMNFMDCQLENGAAVVDGNRIDLSDGVPNKVPTDAKQLEIGIRPEFLRFAGEGESGVPCNVEDVKDLGNFVICTVTMGDGRRLQLKQDEEKPVPSSDNAQLVFPPEWTKLYADSELVG